MTCVGLTARPSGFSGTSCDTTIRSTFFCCDGHTLPTGPAIRRRRLLSSSRTSPSKVTTPRMRASFSFSPCTAATAQPLSSEAGSGSRSTSLGSGSPITQRPGLPRRSQRLQMSPSSAALFRRREARLEESQQLLRTLEYITSVFGALFPARRLSDHDGKSERREPGSVSVLGRCVVITPQAIIVSLQRHPTTTANAKSERFSPGQRRAVGAGRLELPTSCL